MNIILLDPSEVRADGSAGVTGPRAAHVRQVLKAAVGSAVRIGVVDGPLGIGTVAAIDDARVTFACAFEPEIPPRPRVDLLLALPRPKVMRRLWAQLAALGVGRIILTNAERVERDFFDSHLYRDNGWRPLLLEGLQQAKDTRVPVVSVHRQFRKLVEDELDGLCPSGTRLVAHPDETAAPLRASHADRLLLAIGPEGGWNTFELGLLEAHGFQRISLGPRTLATTTACIALMALAHRVLSDQDPDNVRAGSTVAARRAGR